MLVVIAVVLAAGQSRAADTSFVVIIHADNQITELERGFVRDVFLKKTTEWGSGTAIRPIELTSRYSARAEFVRDVIGKTPQQLKNYWNQQIFSGKGVPPPESDSAAAIAAYVVNNPGAIGYIPAGADPRGARVVRVK